MPSAYDFSVIREWIVAIFISDLFTSSSYNVDSEEEETFSQQENNFKPIDWKLINRNEREEINK